MKSTPKKAVDLLFKLDIARINDHLPKQFKTLAALLKEDKPSVLTKDGMKFIFDKKELLEVATKVPEEFHTRLKLPFLFVRRIDFGKSVFFLNGGQLANVIARKLIGLIDEPINQYKLDNVNLPKYFYWADVHAFRKKFKTLFTIGFSASGETV